MTTIHDETELEYEAEVREIEDLLVKMLASKLSLDDKVLAGVALTCTSETARRVAEDIPGMSELFGFWLGMTTEGLSEFNVPNKDFVALLKTHLESEPTQEQLDKEFGCDQAMYGDF